MIEINKNYYDFKISIKVFDSKAKSSEIGSLLDESIKKFELTTEQSNTESEVFRFNNSIDKFSGSREFFDYLADATYWFSISDGLFNPFITNILEDLKFFKQKYTWKEESSFKLKNIDLTYPKSPKELNDYIQIDYAGNKVNFVRPISLDFEGLRKGKFIELFIKKLSKFTSYFQIEFSGDYYFSVPNNQPSIKFNLKKTAGLNDSFELDLSNQALSTAGFNSKDISKLFASGKKASDLKGVIVIGENSTATDVLSKMLFLTHKNQRSDIKKKFANYRFIEVDSKGKMNIEF